MNRVAIITVAGISSRFNRGIAEEDKVLKCLYTEGNAIDTLLYRMIQKLSYADCVIVVGGYKFNELEKYVNASIPKEIREKIELVFNDHYKDLSSGYSLYVGLRKCFDSMNDISDILFVEGDLDVDKGSLNAVIASEASVLTYNREPIMADRSVVLYIDGEGEYNYAFNSRHGLLLISVSFSAIYNSGQVWKFKDIEALKAANDEFCISHIDDTNLAIIQEYLKNTAVEGIELLPLQHWTNCNTRDDYAKIKKEWDSENA